MISSSVLKWDTDFFGMSVHKIEVQDYDKEEIGKAVNSAFEAGAELIYLIIPAQADQMLLFEKELVDKKVIFEKSLNGLRSGNTEISAYADDRVTENLYDIALQSGEHSRFRLDKRFPEGSYEKLYRIWIEKSVSGELADSVLVFRDGGTDIEGLITVKLKEKCGEIGLLASDGSVHGKGIGSKLISSAENFVISRGIFRMEVATQLDNAPACRFYEKNGYSVKKVLNYYHIRKT